MTTVRRVWLVEQRTITTICYRVEAASAKEALASVNAGLEVIDHEIDTDMFEQKVTQVEGETTP